MLQLYIVYCLPIIYGGPKDASYDDARHDRPIVVMMLSRRRRRIMPSHMARGPMLDASRRRRHMPRWHTTLDSGTMMRCRINGLRGEGCSAHRKDAAKGQYGDTFL